MRVLYPVVSRTDKNCVHIHGLIAGFSVLIRALRHIRKIRHLCKLQQIHELYFGQDGHLDAMHIPKLK